MHCNKLHKLLTSTAAQYIQLGYQIGTTKDKVLVDEYVSYYRDPASWNSISIILDGLVCVDLDHFTSLDKKYVLPATLKERSPRGLHYFYRLPARFRGVSKIGWKHKIDLLTRRAGQSVRYGGGAEEFKGHVLCSPSKGYTRLYPKAMPRKMELPMAPEWLLASLK